MREIYFHMTEYEKSLFEYMCKQFKIEIPDPNNPSLSLTDSQSDIIVRNLERFPSSENILVEKRNE